MAPADVVAAELLALVTVTVDVLAAVDEEPEDPPEEPPQAPIASAHAMATVARRALMGPVSLRVAPSPAPRCHYAPTITSSETEIDPAPPHHHGEHLARRLAELDPFWAPQLVVAAAILVGFLLPEKLTIGPSWLLPSVEGLLLVGLVAASPHPRMRHSPLRRWMALGLIGLVSAVNMVSLILLCHYLLHHHVGSGRVLIFSGVGLWVTNVLLFGLWYWELDRGGPLERAHSSGLQADFLFPQMTDPRYAPAGWMPQLIDYLYVSFTNASAFSPTDTMPLSPVAKVLMAAQSLSALVTVGLIVARAVNIL